MGDNIAISEQGKEVKVKFNTEFDDEDLLSEEEREALKADIEEDPDAAAAKETEDADAAAEAKAKADEDAKETKAKAEADERAKLEAEEKAKAAGEPGTIAKKDDAAAAAAAAAKPAEEPAKIVTDMAPVPTLAGLNDEELKSVNDGLDKAKKDFQEGAIDYDEYLDLRDTFKEQLWAHNVATQFSAESVDTRWEWEQETFLTDEANDWIAGDDVVYSAFAATVNRIMSTEEGAVLPGPDLLAQAREEVASRFSPSHPKEVADQAEEEKKQAALKSAKKKEASKQAPETLAGKPAAEIDDGVGEFEWLDKLDGEAYEKAVEGLSDVQLARYESSI
jgi:hypothetical protein